MVRGATLAPKLLTAGLINDLRRLEIFNSVSLEGYFVDGRGDMSWAHSADPDPEFDAFVEGNAKGGGVLLFGRRTYDLMASFWPTPQAAQAFPVVAEQMNNLPKIVFSRTLEKAAWKNTRIIKGDPVTEVRKLKSETGPDVTMFGSGSIASPLAAEGLFDAYQFVIIPIVLGSGRTIFDRMNTRLALKLTQSRTFRNGNVFLNYEPA